MARAWEPEFIRLWESGASQVAIAQALGIPLGTAKTRAKTLAAQGKIQARPRGGDYPSRQAQARPPGQTRERPPPTVHPGTDDRPPSTADRGPLDIGAAVAAALQPLLIPLITRLEALECRPLGEAPSTVHGKTVHGPPSHPDTSTVHPAPVDPATWELRHLKHSERWTIYVPRAMREELKRRAAAQGQHPSLLVQEALRRYLTEEKPS